MKKAKSLICILLFLVLLVSACGKAETSTAVMENPPAAQPAKSTAPSFSEQDILFLPEDHPPLGETLSGGGEGMTAYGIARSEAVHKDYDAFHDHLEKYPDSPLQNHFAGMYNGDESIGWALVILLDEPENKALLEEITAIGMKTDYRIEKGAGTKAYLEKCLPEVIEKLDALDEKVKSGTPTDEEKELIRRYNPRSAMIMRDMGKIWVEVNIKTPWYSVGENWTEDDMYRDLDHCKELFFKLIGYEDVMGFVYGV